MSDESKPSISIGNISGVSGNFAVGGDAVGGDKIVGNKIVGGDSVGRDQIDIVTFKNGLSRWHF